MQQKGYVANTNDNMAQVIVNRESACGHSCDSCGGGCSNPSISLNLENTLGAKIGDYVIIESKSSTILKTAFVAYIIPLILMLIGIGSSMKVFENMGTENYETYAFLVGVSTLIISYFMLRYVDNKYFKENDSLLEMVEIVKE